MNLSDKLRSLMAEKGITKADLSKQTGLPYTSIDSILKRSDFDKIKLSTLKALKVYFNVSLDYLIIDEIEDVNYGKQYPNLSFKALEVAAAFDIADQGTQSAVRKLLDIKDPPSYTGYEGDQKVCGGSFQKRKYAYEEVKTYYFDRNRGILVIIVWCDLGDGFVGTNDYY